MSTVALVLSSAMADLASQAVGTATAAAVSPARVRIHLREYRVRAAGFRSFIIGAFS
jgi:hypothetical protein